MSTQNKTEELQYILGEDFWTQNNLYKGKVGEDVVATASRKACPKEFGYTVKHNNFGKQYEYCCSSGADVLISHPTHQTVAIEVKNLSDQKKPYGTDFVSKHVIPRLAPYINCLKILVITFLHLLTRTAQQLLADNGITVLATNTPLDTTFKRTSQLHILASNLKRLITTKRAPVVQYTSSTLVQYPSSSSLATPIEALHDTPLSDEQILTYLKTVVRPRWIDEQLKHLEEHPEH